jgi:hypothetical protein
VPSIRRQHRGPVTGRFDSDTDWRKSDIDFGVCVLPMLVLNMHGEFWECTSPLCLAMAFWGRTMRHCIRWSTSTIGLVPVAFTNGDVRLGIWPFSVELQPY